MRYFQRIIAEIRFGLTLALNLSHEQVMYSVLNSDPPPVRRLIHIENPCYIDWTLFRVDQLDPDPHQPFPPFSSKVLITQGLQWTKVYLMTILYLNMCMIYIITIYV